MYQYWWKPNTQATSVFGVVTSDDDIMFKFIFPLGLRLNIEIYINGLEKVVLLSIEKVAAWRSYILQQDCAMPHKQENSILAVRKFL